MAKRVLPVLLMLAGVCCHGHGPSTRSWIYNQSMSSFTVEGHQVEVNFSHSVYTAHGVTDTVELERGAVECFSDTGHVYQLRAYAYDNAPNGTSANVTVYVRR